MRIAFRSLLAVGLMIGCLGAAGAVRAADEQSEQLLYVIQFGGLSIADVMLTFTETPDRYQTGATLRSRGLMKLFGKFKADAAGAGTLTKADPGVQPQFFRSGFSMEKLASNLDITYEPKTHLAIVERRTFDPITGELRRPEDTPWNTRRVVAKPVPENKRMGVLDPMAAFVSARQFIRESDGPTSFRVPVFDGMRRYDIVGKSEAPRDYTINNRTRRLIGVKASLVPVFGFDDQSLGDRVREGEGQILFSADGRAVPVQIMMGNSLGVGVLNLVSDCHADPAPCADFDGKQAAEAPPGN